MSSDAGSIPAASTILNDMNERTRRTPAPSSRPGLSSSLAAAARPGAAVPARGPGPSSETIVIDPGHGGLDVGAKGKFGALEKDITLAISLKLKALIEQNLAYRVVLTRDKDIDVSLENRAALANNNDAALFISIHTNGSFRKRAQGAETFFMSLNATDEETRKLAYMENNSAAPRAAHRRRSQGRRQDDPLGHGPVRLHQAERPAGRADPAGALHPTRSWKRRTAGSSRRRSRS